MPKRTEMSSIIAMLVQSILCVVLVGRTGDQEACERRESFISSGALTATGESEGAYLRSVGVAGHVCVALECL